MPYCSTHIANKHRAVSTLLLLLLCVCSAVAREKNRAIALPFEDSVYNFRMMFEYDSWNRVQRIVYPDSEVVSYSYDLGGQLYSVSAFKNNVSSSLINSILYDEFGHRTQVVFGNGITTNYTYDNLQRLSTLQTYSNNASLQKISYSFDYEDNITRVENTASGANGLGGGYTFDYQYDNLYRLTSSTGTFAPNGASYGLEMDFTPAGRVCRKFQDYTGTGNVYAYSPNNKQHAVRRIYNGLTNELSNLLWDNNGNLAQQTIFSVANHATTYQTMRMLFWDEDDRLNLVAGDGYLSYYAYGYDGNRAIKMTGNAAIDQSGMLLNSTNLENITIYPNEYLTVTQAEYTKYYYAGGNRIASKIGTGGFEKMTRLCTQDFNLSANANTLLSNTLQQVVNAASQPTDEFPVNVCGGYSVATELLADPLPDFYISQTNLNFTQNNLLQQFRQNLTNSVEPVYYFHSDHLGSASWITNGSGLPVQHLLYLPFGEHFANEHSSGYDERFTFTGKERDAETGYYYHGARFNSSDIGWLSVDPMADKYPSMSPYAYCAWNPVKLVDPEGRDTAFAGQEERNLYMQYRETVFSNKDFKHIQQELESMEKSDDVFCIRMGKNCSSTEGGGNIIYNVETGQIDINIVEGGDFSPEGKLSHELKHVDQYLCHQLAFAIRGTTSYPYGYDLQDEYEAYERQGTFGETLTKPLIDNQYGNLPLITNRPPVDTDLCKNMNKWTRKLVFIYAGWRKDIPK